MELASGFKVEDVLLSVAFDCKYSSRGPTKCIGDVTKIEFTYLLSLGVLCFAYFCKFFVAITNVTLMI